MKQHKMDSDNSDINVTQTWVSSTTIMILRRHNCTLSLYEKIIYYCFQS